MHISCACALCFCVAGYVDRDEFLKMFGGDQFDEADETDA
jgi:hypothetical protein